MPARRQRMAAPLLLAALALGLAGCGGSSDVTATQPCPTDLDVQYMQRLPKMDYVRGSAHPATDGWPAVGQTVTWHASVKNWSCHSQTAAVSWMLDGNTVATGSITVPAQGTADPSFEWPWTFDRHQLSVVVDPDQKVDEEEEGNNTLTVYTNALSVGFYVEQSLYDYFRAHQKELAGAHSNSFEDWAQRQIARYNQLLANAVYPETPSGVIDRLRLDQITIVPDGALPLVPVNDAGFQASEARPNENDRSVDLIWGFPASSMQGGVYSDTHSVTDNNEFYYSGFVQHELGHARYLIDVYGADVLDSISGHSVDIVYGGKPVAETALMPGTPLIANGDPGWRLYSAPEGLMNAQWTFLDRYSAVMWNRIAGQRARYGNYNAPDDIGVFLNDLAADNRLVLQDANGAAIPNAHVTLFRAHPIVGAANPYPYGRRFGPASDAEFTGDANGVVSIGANPFAGAGQPIQHTDAFSNIVFAIQVETATSVGLAFVPIYEFNIAYETGHRDVASVPVTVTMHAK